MLHTVLLPLAITGDAHLSNKLLTFKSLHPWALVTLNEKQYLKNNLILLDYLVHSLSYRKIPELSHRAL